MGRIATRLEKDMRQTARGRGRGRGRARRCRIDLDMFDLPTPALLEAQGYSPCFALYVAAQNAASAFAEQASRLPAFSSYHAAALAAEDEYMPSGPPMSPLMTSYFTFWAFFDLRFGPDDETMGDCMLHVAAELGLGGRMLEALTCLAASRMGVFVVEDHAAAADGGLVRLRELITRERIVAEVPSGHRAEPGELWYARSLPPLAGVADHGLIVTTPYVLLGASRADWSLYLRRALVSCAADVPGAAGWDDRARLHHLLKYGPTLYYWHEFVMLGYHDFTHEAVFLSGIPDIPASLPHA